MKDKKILWLVLGGIAAYLILFRKGAKAQDASIPTNKDGGGVGSEPQNKPLVRELDPVVVGITKPNVNQQPPKFVDNMPEIKIPTHEERRFENAFMLKYGSVRAKPTKGDRIETQYGIYEFKRDSNYVGAAWELDSWNKIVDKNFKPTVGVGLGSSGVLKPVPMMG